MGSFFDQFRDLDALKEKAEGFFQEGVRETKKQAAAAKLRLRVLDLERRMNSEFRVLGEHVWRLHQNDDLSKDRLEGAFTTLERLAEEIADAKAEMELVQMETDDAEGQEEIADEVIENEPIVNEPVEGESDAVAEAAESVDENGSDAAESGGEESGPEDRRIET